MNQQHTKTYGKSRRIEMIGLLFCKFNNKKLGKQQIIVAKML